MLSIRPVNAGSGYQYLLASVATNDATTDHNTLAGYYAAQGTPPGRWLGSGLDGLNSESVRVGAQINELQMENLYGLGLHPDADESFSGDMTMAQAKLGRPFPVYTDGDPVLEAVREAERHYRMTHGELPSQEVRADLAIDAARAFFTEEHGVQPANGREVLDWVNTKRAKVKQACSAYDFTFSPVKSVSVLWALADEDTASKIASIHHQAVAEAMAWAEEEVVRTRKGAGGIEQVKTRGIMAAEFTHFDTRMGDPDLHSHVLVSNKVQAEDGSWKALDGRTIFRFNQSMSFRYNNVLADMLSREMGLEFQAQTRGEGKEPVWEVRGVDERLLDHFSKRRAAARPVYEKMVADYVATHGVSPSKQTTNALWQRAILDTRDAKKPATSLDDLRASWREEVAGIDGGKQLIAALPLSREQDQSQYQRPVFEQSYAASIITDAADTVTRRRSTFRRSHVHTAVAAKLMGYRFSSTAHRDEIHEQMVESVIAQFGVSMNAPEPLHLPDSLTTGEGRAVDHLLDSEIYTTEAVLAAEHNALDAVIEPVAVFAPSALVTEQLSAHAQREGWALNAGQEQLARHLLTTGTLAATGVGPAGTGKTASMKLVTDVWVKNGGNVIGLAPSAAAANVLSEDIGAPAATIDSLTFVWNGKHPDKPGKMLSELPVKITAGDMILVDEAGMASTQNISALIDIAREAGAIVRFIGDPKQLDAVESGGLFGAMTRTGKTVTLSDVMRFKDDHEQSEASLLIRHGDAHGLDLHFDRGWVSGGAREAMLADAAQGYLADTAAGRSALLMASTNADVAALNEMIRTERIAAGVVDDEHTLAISRGETCGVGDVVLARKNTVFREHGQSTGRVSNGDLFTVEAITPAGDLIVTTTKDRTRQVLPASYVSENVQLGYAATVHRAQGATVDVARAVIDQSVDRAGLYVALTRGKYATYTYAVTEHVLDEDAEQAHLHGTADEDAPTARDVLEKVLRKDDRQLAAIDTLWQEIDAANSPERKKALWMHGHDLAVEAFIATELPAFIDTLDFADAHALVATGDGVAPLKAEWRALLDAGIDPRPVSAQAAASADGYKDLGRLMAYKLQQHLGDATGERHVPPRTTGADVELIEWLAATREDYYLGETSAQADEIPVSFTPGEVIEGAHFAGADFAGRDIAGVQFVDCDFTGARFDQATVDEVTFTRCRLDQASFTQAGLTRVNFHQASMENTDFTEASFGTSGKADSIVNFVSVAAPGITMAKAALHAVKTMWSYLKDIDLRGAALNYAVFINSDLRGAQTDAATTTGFGTTATNCDTDYGLPIVTTRTGFGQFDPAQLPNQAELPGVQTHTEEKGYSL